MYGRDAGVLAPDLVDSGGSLLLLDGGLVDGAMVLEGTAPDDERPERVVRQRITWIPSADGTVVRRALGDLRGRAGATWVTAFDGRFGASRAGPTTSDASHVCNYGLPPALPCQHDHQLERTARGGSGTTQGA